jgi:ribokinase
MPPKFDVIVCGSLHLDIVVSAPALPRIDETAVGTEWKKICGGKGGNQAVQAAAANARTAMIGRVGNDDFGHTLMENLSHAKVDTSSITVDPATGSGMSVAILQDDGDYGAVIVSGANAKIDPADMASLWNELGGARVLVLQNEIPHAVNVAAARTAKAAGATVLFNAAPARTLSPDLTRHVDVLILNRVEAEAASNTVLQDRNSARISAGSLRTESLSVIVTLGGEGLVIAASEGAVTEIEPVPVKVVSTHGAGDCFVGTLAAQLAAEGKLVDACHAANRAAAAFVSQRG